MNKRHASYNVIIDRAVAETIAGYCALFIAGVALMCVAVLL